VFYILGEPGEIFDFYQRLIGRLPEWLWKPLGGCPKCFTGQVCFWFFLLKNYASYNLIDHLFFVSLGILISITLQKLYELAKN
jgi:hypothetical protein